MLKEMTFLSGLPVRAGMAPGEARRVGGRGRSSLAAALMAQRPPCNVLRKRPREEALLEAKRSHQRARGLDEELLYKMLRGLGRARTEISACG